MLFAFLLPLKQAKGFRGFFLSFVLGAVSVLGHAPFYLWPVSLLCLALLFLRLDGVVLPPAKTKRRWWGWLSRVPGFGPGFGTGFAYGLGSFLFGLYWIGSAFIARGPEFIPFMPFAILALCSGLAIFWGVAGALYVRFTGGSDAQSLPNKDLYLRLALFASLIFAMEFLRGHLFGGLPWNLPGYIFPAGKPISQIASVIGIYGLSAVAVYVSAGLAAACYKRYVPALGAVLLLVAISGYGYVRLNNADVQMVEGVKLRIVHANISQRDKFDPQKYVEIVNHYIRLSLSEGIEDVTHVIWPEGAVPGLMFEDPGLMQALDRVFKAAPRKNLAPPPVLIAQSLRSEPRIGGGTAYYNAAAAVMFKDGSPPALSAFYDKQKLVPFGEFIPAAGLLEKVGLRSLSTALESMSAGESGFVPRIEGLPPLSLQICYEIIFPGFTPARVSSRSGQSMVEPEWILNLSNDSWYGNSTGPRQHVNQVRYRAIEEGLPVIRATSGGISGTIDPYGRQVFKRLIGEDEVLDTPLPRYMKNNAYKRHFNAIIFLLNILVLLGCFPLLRRLRRLHPS
jgi:apolipoprotein N-acyltransferase